MVEGREEAVEEGGEAVTENGERCWRLWLKLDAMLKDGKGDTRRADDIRRDSKPLWRSMTEEDRVEFYKRMETKIEKEW